MDIRKNRNFLEKEFRWSHCLSSYLPRVWPDKKSITSLVERSSGHFVYATTVIRYIQSDQHRPWPTLSCLSSSAAPGTRPTPTRRIVLFEVSRTTRNSRKSVSCLELSISVKSVLLIPKPTPSARLSKGFLEWELVMSFYSKFRHVAINNDEVRILHKSLID